MSITFKAKTAVIRPYRREILSGVGGAGKSTALGVVSKRPMVVDLDHRWPRDLVEKSDFPEFKETYEGLKALCADILSVDSIPNDRIIFDTATKVVELIDEHSLIHDCKGSKEAFNAYAHGQKFSNQYFKEFLDLIDQIQAKHKVTVTFICHSTKKDQRNNGGEVYQKHCLNLTDKIADKLKQWADYIGFVWMEVAVDAKARKSLGDQIRYISFNDNPDFEAKNSSPFVLPDRLEFDKDGAWAEVMFGGTQELLRELDTILAGIQDAAVKKVIVDSIAENGVRSYGYVKLKEFVEAGKAKFQKGGK